MKIDKIIFISTQRCNLQCQYCYLEKTKIDKDYYNFRHNEITKSLNNKTYIDNYITGLKRINQDPKNIEEFDFWGQEPTLNIEDFFQNFDYFYENFPNVKKCLFSTNGINNAEKIFNIINITDNIVNNDFTFYIQLSIDGVEYNEANRGIQSSLIIQNISDLIKKLNEIKLQKVKVSFHFHNVLSKNMFSSLSTQEEINLYWDHLNGYGKNLKKLNNNKNVEIIEVCSPGIEFPILKASKQDGENLFNFLNKSLQGSGKQNFFTIFDKIKKNKKFLLSQGIDFEYILNILRTGDYLNTRHKEIYQNLSHGVACGTQGRVLRMDYDGTLSFCQNSMFQRRLKDFDKEMNTSDLYFKNLVKHNFYPNLLTSSLDELNYYFDFYHSLINTSFGMKFINIINLMTWLSECNLISYIYKINKNKLLLHAFICSWLQTCPHADIAESGSVYGKSLDLVKLYCNGTIDLIEDYIFNDNEIEVKYYE